MLFDDGYGDLKTVASSASKATPHQLAHPGNCDNLSDAVYAPSGTRIAATCARTVSGTFRQDIVTANPAGGGTATFLTTSGGSDPDWG